MSWRVVALALVLALGVDGGADLAQAENGRGVERGAALAQADGRGDPGRAGDGGMSGDVWGSARSLLDETSEGAGGEEKESSAGREPRRTGLRLFRRKDKAEEAKEGGGESDKPGPTVGQRTSARRQRAGDATSDPTAVAGPVVAGHGSAVEVVGTPGKGGPSVAERYWDTSKGGGLLFPLKYPKFNPRGIPEGAMAFLTQERRGKNQFVNGKEVRFNFDTCAVVGSSKVLKRAKDGAAIDNHTAVFRFNEAPAKGSYVPHVGTKTTIRIQNSVFCGYSESADEYCMPMQGGAVPNCMRSKKRKCTVVNTPGPLLNYGGAYFSTIPAPKAMKSKDRACRATRGKCGRRMSGGFFGVMMAMNLCQKVDVYGFTHKGGGDHYYPKKVPKNIRKPWQEKHHWTMESAAFKQLSKVPGVRVIT